MASVYVIKKRLETAKERLELYLAAEKAILEGAQSYSLGTRSLTRADLGKIQDEIEELYKTIDELESLAAGKSARKAFAAVPRDF